MLSTSVFVVLFTSCYLVPINDLCDYYVIIYAIIFHIAGLQRSDFLYKALSVDWILPTNSIHLY